MQTIINKNLSKVILILIGLFLFPGAILSGCSEVPKPAPTITPVEIQPTQVISLEIEELFDRYSVVGIAQDSYLSVHGKPSADSLVVGQIPSYGTDILPTGDIYQQGNITWVFIGHQDTVGWVDLGFLAEQHGTLPKDLIILGQQVLASLKTEQYDQLLPFIHPETCLRFSPYQNLNPDNQIVCPPDLASLTGSLEPITWGQFDGTGKPIDLTFFDYHQQFVYDQDYLKSSVIGFNLEVSSGNSINNIQEIFPNGIMIEYHFPGTDPRYGGMDWRSLRLVFVPENDQWYLTAIIHGEWTI